MKIEKIDAHHHLWAMASSHYPMMMAPDAERFIGNTGRLKHDFELPDYLAVAAGQNIIKSIYVESHFSPPCEESAFVQAIANEHGFPNAIVGRADLAGGELHGELDIHMRSQLFRGVRVMANWDADPKFRGAPEGLLRDVRWRQGYAELGERGLIAEIMAFPDQLADLADVAEISPHTTLVVGHAGMPLRRDAREDAVWRRGMTRLAALPHTVVKISGLGMCDHHWTIDSIRPLVQEIVALFTPSRCMFASNFPVDRLYASFDQVWDAFDAITADVAPADRTALFRGTASRVFGIG